MIGREKPGEQSEVAQLIQQTLEQERWQREMMEQRYKQYMDDDEEVGKLMHIQEAQTCINNMPSCIFHTSPGVPVCTSTAGFLKPRLLTPNIFS